MLFIASLIFGLFVYCFAGVFAGVLGIVVGLLAPFFMNDEQ